MKRRVTFEKSNNFINNNAVIQDLKNELLELVNQSDYSRDLKEYILLALECHEFIQPTIEFLKENKTQNESEVMERVFDVVQPQLIYYVDDNKEKYYKNKAFYLKHCYELFDIKENLASKIEKQWFFDYLSSCTSDVRWDDNSKGLIVIEMIDLFWYFKQCGNKMQGIIFDTDILEDINKYLEGYKPFVMIYVREEEVCSCFQNVWWNSKSNVCLVALQEKNDLPKKYQIGIMNQVKEGDKDDQ